ncbi:MAG: DUF4062 domain-containing protein [Pseudomonadota bacterium]
MRPKYQVFISSTFADLREARERVTWTVLELRHIPAGMENFSAANDRGWETITRVIDQSDYYILLLAGRYGSTRPDGVSWTEAEYHYAVERGIPVLPFLRADNAITSDKAEREPGALRRLQDFKELVRGNHLCATWGGIEDLSAKVAAALPKHIADDEDARRPRPGWLRGDQVPGPLVVEELARLTRQNEDLRSQVVALHALSSEPEVRTTLRNLLQAGRCRARFAGSVAGLGSGQSVGLSASDRNHGNIDNLDEHGVQLKMDEMRMPFVSRPTQGGVNVPHRVITIPRGRPLTIPWTLVRAVWPDPAENNLIHVDISAAVIWDGQRWVLRRE